MAWLRGYHELVSRMSSGWLFGMEKGSMAVLEPGGVWRDFSSPAALESFLGLSPAVKPSTKPVVVSHGVVAPITGPVSTSGLPSWVGEWLARMVYEPKRDYCARFAASVLCGAAVPDRPAGEWVDKAEARFAWLARKS